MQIWNGHWYESYEDKVLQLAISKNMLGSHRDQKKNFENVFKRHHLLYFQSILHSSLPHSTVHLEKFNDPTHTYTHIYVHTYWKSNMVKWELRGQDLKKTKTQKDETSMWGWFLVGAPAKFKKKCPEWLSSISDGLMDPGESLDCHWVGCNFRESRLRKNHYYRQR